MQPKLFHLYALSSLHCGTGQSMGVIDLPIARARASQFPIVPGSSLRGVLRQQITEQNPKVARALFGPKSIASNADAFAGALAIDDAHLLALPVRCLAGIVSYVTAPFILKRYARDLELAGNTLPGLPEAPSGGEARVTASSVNCLDGKLVLEDLDLLVKQDASLEKVAGRVARHIHPENPDARDDLHNRFALVPDDIMSFLAETATEVRARIAIDPSTGTVRKGALWYEENLPAETLLWGMLALSPSNDGRHSGSPNELAPYLSDASGLLQLGGNAGVGRGLVRLLIESKEEARL